MDTILKLIISKGHYSAKKKEQELQFLFSTRPLMLVYICTKFHENIPEGIKVIEQTRFSLEKFQRRVSSQKLLVKLQFFFSAHCLILVYFSTQFHENIFGSF